MPAREIQLVHTHAAGSPADGTNKDKTITAAELFAEVTDLLSSGFGQTDWAEDEVQQAMRRHPAKADEIWHSFGLLKPTHERLSYELVYRAHCREILDRVAARADTRPGTAAEVCVACSAASLVAPLGSAVAGLYGRMFSAAFPQLPPMFGDRQGYHEALEGGAIDELEADARRRLSVKDRQVTEINCAGRHHGEAATCRFAQNRAAA
jgi:hypothetical protein